MDKTILEKDINNTSLIEKAYGHFKKEDYLNALEAYEKISDEIGETFTDYYIQRLCKNLSDIVLCRHVIMLLTI